MPLQPADFVHLHVHSEYSLLDGANRIGPMIDHVKKLGQPAIALTDHGVLYGALEFYQKATKAGIKPLVGCEVYITPNHRTDRGPAEKKQTHHLLLLAKDYEGYRNICKLSSIGHTEGFYYKPRIDFETLEKHSAGVLGTSSCLAGLIPQAILDGNMEKAHRLTGQFVDIFGRDNFFMELQDHQIREQDESNPGIIEIARAQDLKLIATNDCHYMTRGDAHMHDVLLCVQTGARLADPNRMRFHKDQFYIKSTAEMESLFSDLPEALTNTRLVAEMCDLQMPERQYRLPKFPCPEGMSEGDTMRQKVWEGARERYGRRADEDEDLRARIEFEIQTIEGMGFPAYFLIVADFIEYARKEGIPVGPGRGSAAGSVVAYCLKITELCPLEHGLLFERFLNPDRLSMPDIDIDFCFERRGEVIEYVRRKYGEQCVAQIITFGTMKAKAAVRDVGRVMEVPLNVVDQVAKAIPGDPKMTIKKAIEDSPELREMRDKDKAIADLLDMASRIEGMARHASTHAAGIIISDQDITEYCPLFKSPNEDRPATQFTMTECEESLGLLKMDFLGIKNLTIIHRVCTWLKEREGIVIDWDAVPDNDPPTYVELQKGHTLGVFQLESEGMTALVKRMKPTEFADLTALLALYRPGPLGQGMHDMYVRRKHHQEKVAYDHPVLEPILRETYGVILYQEQVMRIAIDMCGFTRGDADTLRKAMGKKKLDVMEKMKPKWLEGAPVTSGVSPDLADKIWNDIVSFASYGFNKSHSAAYAVVTFRTAYLRAHYPTYFLAALLTNEIGGNTDNISKYVSHCREVGIDVLPPDINRSREYFNPDGDKIWYALNGVKGVGTGFAKAVVAERQENGDFKSLQDLCLRLPRESVNSRVLEALIKVGAFDHFERNRAAQIGALAEILELSASAHRQKADGLDDLFDVSGGEEAESLVQEIPMADVEPWDDKTRAGFEKEFLGFYLSDHPLKRFEIEFESFCDTRACDIDELASELGENDRIRITLMGTIVDINRRTDKNGNPWGIVQLEDMTGHFEVKFFARSYGAYYDELQPDRVVQIEGNMSLWNGRVSLEGYSLTPAEELRNSASGIELIWNPANLSQAALYELAEVAKRFAGPRPVHLILELGNSLLLRFGPEGAPRMAPTTAALDALRKLPGSPRVRLIPGRKETRNGRSMRRRA